MGDIRLPVLLILLAFVPFVKFLLNDHTGGLNLAFPLKPADIITTGYAVTAASDNKAGFLLRDESLFNFFIDRYNNGFFIDSSNNPLYSTFIALQSLRSIGKFDSLPQDILYSISAASKSYFADNYDKPWFSPQHFFSYYYILSFLNEPVNAAEIISGVLRFKVSGSGFAVVENASLANVETTFFAVVLLNELGFDFSSVRSDILSFVSTTRLESDRDYLYYTIIGKVLGEKFTVSREKLGICLIKEYLPLVDSSDCMLILSDKLLLPYIPSILLLIISYVLFMKQ